MSGEKTEAPTSQRRREARQKGQVAKSAEVNSAAILLAAFWLLNIIGGYIYQALDTVMRRSFSALSMADLTFETMRSGAMAGGGVIVQAVAPLILTLMLVGVVANVGQVGFLLSSQSLAPDPKRIDPISGLKRLFSPRSLVELVKSLLKLTLIGSVVYSILRDNYDLMAATGHMALPVALSQLTQIGLTIGLRVALIMFVLAAADYAYQRYEFEKNLKMSKQEIRDEMKRQENPEIKRRIRTRQREMAIARMMSAVPEADVVITNPTHLAVALQYKQGKMAAPKVVAKGQRLVAERIKEKAREHQVPLVENKPLARALFKSVEIGQDIPAELYKATAEVLAFVYQLKTKRPIVRSLGDRR